MAWVLRYFSDIGYPPGNAMTLYRHALAIFEESGDRRGVAETLFRLGWVSSWIGEYRNAERFYRESLEISKQIDRYEVIAHCLVESGYVLWAQGQYKAAHKRCLDSLSYYRQIGYTSQVAFATRYLARVSMGLGNWRAAQSYLQESLRSYEEIGLRGMKAIVLGELASVAVLEGRLAEAERLAEAGRATCEDLGFRAGSNVDPMVTADIESKHDNPLTAWMSYKGLTVLFTAIGDIEKKRGNPLAAWRSYRDAMQTAREIQKPSDALHAMAGMAMLHAEEKHNLQAAQLAFYIQDHPATWQWTRACIRQLVSTAETELSPHRRLEVQQWGQDKTIEDVINAADWPDD